MTREQIEDCWLTLLGDCGYYLCDFLYKKLPFDTYLKWQDIWHKRQKIPLCYFSTHKIKPFQLGKYFETNEEAYLCRALFLNMFLDDNGYEEEQ